MHAPSGPSNTMHTHPTTQTIHRNHRSLVHPPAHRLPPTPTPTPSRYMTGTTHARNHCLKLIPHIADGSWMIKQSVGTTPVILGKQLRTIYYETPQVRRQGGCRYQPKGGCNYLPKLNQTKLN